MAKSTRVNKKSLREAKKRDMVDAKTVQSVAPRIHRRVCPACGEKFRPVNEGQKGFCCGHCAYAWGVATDADATLRVVDMGLEVVVYETGQLGVVKAVLKQEEVVLLLEDGTKLTLPKKGVEPILYLEIEHDGKCPKSKNTFFQSKQQANILLPVEEGEGTS